MATIMFPCALNGELGMAYRTNGRLYRDMTKEPKSRARTIKNGINLIPRWEKDEACFVSFRTLACKEAHAFNFSVVKTSALTMCSTFTSLQNVDTTRGVIAKDTSHNFGIAFFNSEAAAQWMLESGSEIEVFRGDGKLRGCSENTSYLYDRSEEVVDWEETEREEGDGDNDPKAILILQKDLLSMV